MSTTRTATQTSSRNGTESKRAEKLAEFHGRITKERLALHRQISQIEAQIEQLDQQRVAAIKQAEEYHKDLEDIEAIVDVESY